MQFHPHPARVLRRLPTSPLQGEVGECRGIKRTNRSDSASFVENEHRADLHRLGTAMVRTFIIRANCDRVTDRAAVRRSAVAIRAIVVAMRSRGVTRRFRRRGRDAVKIKAIAAAGLLCLASASAWAESKVAAGLLAPREVVGIVRASGYLPTATPVREDLFYGVRAVDSLGRPVRLVVDARSGDILAAQPVAAPRATDRHRAPLTGRSRAVRPAGYEAPSRGADLRPPARTGRSDPDRPSGAETAAPEAAKPAQTSATAPPGLSANPNALSTGPTAPVGDSDRKPTGSTAPAFPPAQMLEPARTSAGTSPAPSVKPDALSTGPAVPVADPDPKPPGSAALRLPPARMLEPAQTHSSAGTSPGPSVKPDALSTGPAVPVPDPDPKPPGSAALRLPPARMLQPAQTHSSAGTSPGPSVKPDALSTGPTARAADPDPKPTGSAWKAPTFPPAQTLELTHTSAGTSPGPSVKPDALSTGPTARAADPDPKPTGSARKAPTFPPAQTLEPTQTSVDAPPGPNIRSIGPTVPIADPDGKRTWSGLKPPTFPPTQTLE